MNGLRIETLAREWCSGSRWEVGKWLALSNTSSLRAEEGDTGAETQFDLLVSWLSPVLRRARGGYVPLPLVAGH